MRLGDRRVHPAHLAHINVAVLVNVVDGHGDLVRVRREQPAEGGERWIEHIGRGRDDRLTPVVRCGRRDEQRAAAAQSNKESSSPAAEQSARARAAAEEVAAAGIPAHLGAGYAPTPAVACAIRQHQLAGGIVITASHNPWAWNGFKFKFFPFG